MLDAIFLKSFKNTYVYCDPCVLKEYECLENTAQYQFVNTYLYDPCFFYASTRLPTLQEFKLSYLNINGLLHSDHLECLRNDLNLISSDIICIAVKKISMLMLVLRILTLFIAWIMHINRNQWA